MNTQDKVSKGVPAATVDDETIRAHLLQHWERSRRFPSYLQLRQAYPAGFGRLVRIRRSVEAQLKLPPARRRRRAGDDPTLREVIQDLVHSVAALEQQLDAVTGSEAAWKQVQASLRGIEKRLDARASSPAATKPQPAPVDSSVQPVLAAIAGLAAEQRALLGEVRGVQRSLSAPPAPPSEPIQALQACVTTLQDEVRQQSAERAQQASQAAAVLSEQAQAIAVVADKVNRVALLYQGEHKSRKEKQVELDAQLFELLHRIGATHDLIATLGQGLQGRLDEIAASSAPASSALGLEPLRGSIHAAQQKGFAGLAQSLGRKIRVAATRAAEAAAAQQQSINALRARLPAHRSGRALRPADIEVLRGLLADAIKGGSDSVVRRLRAGQGAKRARRGASARSSSRPSAASRRRVSAGGAPSRKGRG